MRTECADIETLGVREGWNWGGVSPSQPTRGSGSVNISPAGSGADLLRSQTHFQHFLSVTDALGEKKRKCNTSA